MFPFWQQNVIKDLSGFLLSFIALFHTIRTQIFIRLAIAETLTHTQLIHYVLLLFLSIKAFSPPDVLLYPS